MTIALFDLDLTVLDINSAHLWIRAERQLGHISLGQLLQAAWLLTRYRFGASDLDDALLSAIKTLAGQREVEFNARIDSFYEHKVKSRVRPGAREAIAAHRSRGDLCYLMTSASSHLSERFAHDLSLDGALAQRFEVHEGCFTGRPDGGLCFGAGKLRRAQALLDELGLSLRDCAFYTDSASDIPLLEAVGSPQVVHPDQKLARVAAQRGWPIHRWTSHR